jgi:hypothetical protein
MPLSFLNGEPFTTSATTYQHRPATVYETHPRLILRVAFEGMVTLAMVDTGGVYLFCHPSIARAIGFDASAGLGLQTLIFRQERVQSTLHRATLTLLADEGDHLLIETTAFVPEASYDGLSDMPSILGWHGCLDRFRFGIDPMTDTFYFGAPT